MPPEVSHTLEELSGMAFILEAVECRRGARTKGGAASSSWGPWSSPSIFDLWGLIDFIGKSMKKKKHLVR
jgi:hypothetical protein